MSAWSLFRLPPVKKIFLVLTCFVLTCALTVPSSATEVKSPDGRLAVAFQMQDGVPVYQVTRDGKTIISESRLGLELAEGPLTGLEIIGAIESSRDETWKPVYGERSSYRDHYHQLVVDLKKVQLTFRVFDEGVAFCYSLPQGDGTVTIVRENTEFRFPADHTAWATYAAQGNYEKVPLSKIKPGCERPLTIQAADDLYLAIGEAKLVDYARMKLAPLKDVPRALISDLSGPVTAALPLTTPWRFIMVADSPGSCWKTTSSCSTSTTRAPSPTPRGSSPARSSGRLR